MRVAVLEYLSGGGLCDARLPSNAEGHAKLLEPLFREGLSMLSALCLDLVLCGHTVVTCLDENAAGDPTATSLRNRSVRLSIQTVAHDWRERWTEIALQCDRVIVIAPELHQQLERIVSELRDAGADVVASTALFLEATSDKLQTAHRMQRANVPHPATQSLTDCKLAILPVEEEHACSESEAMPMTLKRRDGAGCSEMKYFENRGQLIAWLEQVDRPNWNDAEWIVQRWQPGMAASMAVVAAEQWHLVGSMEQSIAKRYDAKSDTAWMVEYHGGTGPIESVSSDQLERLLAQVRTALPDGASGWIGIDFVAVDLPTGEMELVLIEVNPRLTTSYLGYRQWYGYRLADCLLGCLDVAELCSQCEKPLRRITFAAN